MSLWGRIRNFGRQPDRFELLDDPEVTPEGKRELIRAEMQEVVARLERLRLEVAVKGRK